METQTDIRRAIEAAADHLRRYGAREVYLFGSAATGTLRPDSDVDMAVEGLPPAVFFRAVGELMHILDRPVDLIDLDHDDPFTRALKSRGNLTRV